MTSPITVFLVNFVICQFSVTPGPFEYFPKRGCLQTIKVFHIYLVKGGQVSRLYHGTIGGGRCHRCHKLSFLTHLQQLDLCNLYSGYFGPSGPPGALDSMGPLDSMGRLYLLGPFCPLDP